MIDVLTSVALAIDPVPWARSQMAFTLAFHIILVPLGVSWSVMTLIANYRGIKHGDPDAMLLAQRWSKYMAVTFAVGAVTGTVLSFEFGLLWPKFMGQWGAAFGVPFAFEGIFFFTEAVFISIYIFGWRRLKPWAHFWTGVPIAIAGIFGSISVVAANAWMNSPEGVTLDSSGKVDRRRPDGGDLQRRDAADGRAHGRRGVPGGRVHGRLRLRGRDAAGPHATATTGSGFIIGFTVAAIATPVQMGVGDGLARWVYNEQPTKFAAIEMVPKTSSDVPEVLFGHLNSKGEVVGGIPIPGLASILSDPGKGTSTVIQGLDEMPAADRPTNQQVNVTHLAWDLMVGLGTLLFLLTLWWWAAWIFRRDMPKSRWFLRAVGRLRGARGDHHGGGLDRQRGRTSALDRLREDEGRGRRHREHRDLDHLHRRGDPLHRPRRDDDPGAAADEPPVPARVTAPARPTCPTGRASRRPERAGRRRTTKVPLG